MPNLLYDMEISEISLVDDPASPGSEVVLYKRRTGDADMPDDNTPDRSSFTIDDFAKALNDAEAELTKVRADLATATTDLAKAKTDLATAEGEVTKAKAATTPQSEEDFLKSLPEAGRAIITKQREEAAEMRASIEKIATERETSDFVAKARGYGKLPIKPEDLGGIMFRLSKGKTTPADIAEVERVLKAAGAASGPLLSAVGTDSTADIEKAVTTLDNLAKARAEKDNTSFAVAYERVVRERPELYTRYLTEHDREVRAGG